MGFFINSHRFGGNCYTVFDGVNESISLTNASAFDVEYNNSFSIGGWFNFDDLSDVNLLAKFNSSNIGYYLRRHPTLGLMFQKSNGSFGDTIKTSNALSINTWYHICITNSTAGLISGMKIYVDGSLVSTTTHINTLGTNTIKNTSNLIIGTRDDGLIPFDGNSEELFFSSSELSASEITDIYNQSRINPDYSVITGIVSHWELDALNPPDEIGSNDGTSVNMDSTNIVCE